MASREDTIGSLLRSAGLRRTPVRVAVLALVTAARRPQSAPEIIRRLGEDADPVTVYRTLNTLAEHHLVHRVRGDDGAWHYASTPPATGHEHAAAAAGEHSHAHFVCDSCGVVECIDKLAVPDAFARPKELGRRYDVAYAEVTLHGTCPRCHV